MLCGRKYHFLKVKNSFVNDVCFLFCRLLDSSSRSSGFFVATWLLGKGHWN
jgi:hypothetical protein